MVVVHHVDEPGFVPLDIDALSNEQAIELSEKLHHIFLDFSDIRDLLPMSVRLSRAMSYLRPETTTIGQIRTKPLWSWRQHPCMNPSVYHELRELLIPHRLYLPVWETLP